MSWFRFYDEALDDPKVQRLPGELFKTWVNLLALCSRLHGRLPSRKDIAFALRMSETAANKALQSLQAAGLIDVCETGDIPHNWNVRQYVSDVSTDRVKRFRKRARNVSETANATPPDTDADTDADTDTDTERVVVAVAVAPVDPPRGKPDRKTKLPEGWVLPDEWREYAIREYPMFNVDREAERFHDRQLANNGKYVDWFAAWRNWLKGAEDYGRNKRANNVSDLEIYREVARQGS